MSRLLRFAVVSALTLAPAAACVAGPAAPLVNPTGAAAPGAAAPAPGDMTVDQALDALDQRGQNLQAFDAAVRLKEVDTGTQLESTRTGHVWYQKQGDISGRLRVVFDTRIDGAKRIAEKLEYLLENGWLTDRDYQKRIEVKRQVLRPGEKVNLLKLGEGPFPLPIGQKKEDVKKLFDVTKVKADKSDPPGTVHLVLRPIKGTQFAKKFSAIDVWVDTKTSFPVRIDTLDPKEVISRSTELTDVRVNPKLGDADFALPKIEEDKWNIHEEPFRE